jgi:hypothetical protein
MDTIEELASECIDTEMEEENEENVSGEEQKVSFPKSKAKKKKLITYSFVGSIVCLSLVLNVYFSVEAKCVANVKQMFSHNNTTYYNANPKLHAEAIRLVIPSNLNNSCFSEPFSLGENIWINICQSHENGELLIDIRQFLSGKATLKGIQLKTGQWKSLKQQLTGVENVTKFWHL